MLQAHRKWIFSCNQEIFYAIGNSKKKKKKETTTS